MLVKINPLLGANSDARCRAINLMRAVKAVANAAAGATPTCNVISGPSGTLEANQMITVIANTEAGGWAVDTNADPAPAALARPWWHRCRSPAATTTRQKRPT